MIRQAVNKLLVMLKKYKFRVVVVLLRKITFKIAFSTDRFKKLILLAVGVVKYARGLKSEARAYWRIAGFRQNANERRDGSSEYYDEKYYNMMEDKNYGIYIESAKKLVLSTFPEKDDEICDIGCGRGFLVRELQKEGYTKTIGVEISKWAVEYKVTENVYLKNIDDFKESEFRVISLISILEHLKKEELQPFLKEIYRITADYVVCCIPIYPNNLFDSFFHDADHQIFERREWWDKEFKKIGFYPWVLPREPLPFITPFVYKKVKVSDKENKQSKRARQSKDSSQIHFAIDISSSNAFTWVTAKLASTLDSLGYGVSIKPSSLPNTVAVEDRAHLEQFMKKTPAKEIEIKWSHYFKPYLKEKLNGDLNLEIFATNYFFKDNDKKKFDYWIKSVLTNNYYKLPISTFCQDVLIKAGVSKDRCFVLPLGFSPEIMTVEGKIDLPTTKRFKFLAVTNAADPNRYGTDILMRAFTQAFSKEDDVVLIIKDYGGKDADIERIICQHQGNPEIVYITQFLSKDNLIRLYKSCDVFVSPFRGEGFGMKILDAMACGLPTILPLFSGPTEYAHPQTCFPVEYKIVPMGDCLDTKNLRIGNNPHWCEVKVDSLIEVMRYVYENPKEAKMTAIKGREFILSEFSWEHVATKLVNIIENLEGKEVLTSSKKVTI